MNSIREFLSVKPRIICKCVFRSQSSNYHEASFAKKKLTAPSSRNFILKKDLGSFLLILWNFKKTFFAEAKHLRETASEHR